MDGADQRLCFNFLPEGPILTTDEYPCDMDTTSFGLMMDQPDDRVVNSVMDEMLQYTSQDGITMVSGRLHPLNRHC